MTGTVLMALAPLPPQTWLGRRRAGLPFPLEEPGCTLYARGRHALAEGVRSLGIGPGDEILAPAYHHGSEIEAFRRTGASCVFYEPNTRLEPDPDRLDELRGDATRALHLIHHLGFPQDAARWRAWCDARGLALIEDAAQAWLAQANGRPAGAFGDLAIFCLYKTFGLPDGGALHCPAGAARSAGRGDVAGLRLVLEHVAWLAGRSAVVGDLAARRRPRRYDPSADFALGTPRPPSRATRLALRRVADPAAALRRRANYAVLLEHLGDLVPPPFDELVPGACPFVLPVRVADKPRFLSATRASGVRALDLWSVAHPSLPSERFPRVAALRASLAGLPVHQELRRGDLDRIAAVARPAAAP